MYHKIVSQERIRKQPQPVQQALRRLNAGATEMIDNDTKKNKILGVDSTKKISDKFYKFDKKVLPDLQMSYYAGGAEKKAFGITEVTARKTA